MRWAFRLFSALSEFVHLNLGDAITNKSDVEAALVVGQVNLSISESSIPTSVLGLEFPPKLVYFALSHRSLSAIVLGSHHRITIACSHLGILNSVEYGSVLPLKHTFDSLVPIEHAVLAFSAICGLWNTFGHN